VLAASVLSSRGAIIWKNVARRFLSFTPFCAMVVAFLLGQVEYPPLLTDLLQKLSATMIPLALLSVGYQMRFSPRGLAAASRPLAFGLLYKLFIGPALIALIFMKVLGASGEVIRITIVQAAMAPMITGAIVAADYGLDSEIANLMISIGIPLSLFTVPFWAFVLK
jgi:predicted permease